MGESDFPRPAEDVLATLIEIFKHQKKAELVDLLERSRAYFDQTDYDNWNGGTYTWALRLEVPVRVFAFVEPRLEAIEKEIGQKLAYLERIYPNNNLGEVTITPIADEGASLGQRPTPPEAEVERLWPEGFCRLFLSHLAKHKVQVSKLKEELSLLGVAGFVAHEDIEPSLEWRDEIELGLRSMHALAALVTPEFELSKWTDQEIGWAFGRGVPVIPVRLGADPYGFAGKFQAVNGNLDQPATTARAIVEALLSNRTSRSDMRRSLVHAFSRSESYGTSIWLSKVIVKVTDFTTEEIERIRNTCVENNQVGHAFGVSARIFQAFGKPGPQ